MSAPAITLPLTATAGDAALLMARRGIRHVVLVDAAGALAGVVSERDLFSLQRLSVRELASAIRRAADIPTLVQCATDVRALSYALVAQGVASGQLTRMISSLNDQLAVRILELVTPQHDLDGLTLCWLGMGSEGRERADDRDRPGQRPHLHHRSRRHHARRCAHAPAAGRAGRQRSDGSLRLSAVQGRRDGDESALVREPRRVEGVVRQLDRPWRPGQPAGGEHLLRLSAALGRRRRSRMRCAPRSSPTRQANAAVSETDVGQRAAQPAAAQLARRAAGRRRTSAARRRSTSR